MHRFRTDAVIKHRVQCGLWIYPEVTIQQSGGGHGSALGNICDGCVPYVDCDLRAFEESLTLLPNHHKKVIERLLDMVW